MPCVYEGLWNIEGRPNWLIVEISDDSDCKNETYHWTNAIIDLDGNIIHSFHGYDVQDLGEEMLLLHKSENKGTRERYIQTPMPLGMALPRFPVEYKFVDLRDPKFKPTSSFKTTGSIFKFQENGLADRRNRKGKIIIPNNYTYSVSEYYPQLVSLVHYTKKNGKGVIDINGKWIVPAAYTDISFELEGLIVVEKKSSKSGVYNVKGKQVVAPIYNYVNITHDGYIHLEKMDGKCGVKNATGKQILPCLYNYVRYPGNNKLIIELNDKWWKYDIATHKFTPLNYEFIHEFKNGYASVRINRFNLNGILDANLNEILVVPNNFEIKNLGNGLFLFKENKTLQFGIFDAKNKENLVPPCYTWLEESYACMDINFYAQKNDKWGLIDINNNVLIPFIYNKQTNIIEAEREWIKAAGVSAKKIYIKEIEV